MHVEDPQDLEAVKKNLQALKQKSQLLSAKGGKKQPRPATGQNYESESSRCKNKDLEYEYEK